MCLLFAVAALADVIAASVRFVAAFRGTGYAVNIVNITDTASLLSNEKR